MGLDITCNICGGDIIYVEQAKAHRCTVCGIIVESLPSPNKDTNENPQEENLGKADFDFENRVISQVDDGESFSDDDFLIFLTLVRKKNDAEQKCFLRMAEKIFSKRNKFADYFISTIQKESFGSIINIFETQKSHKNTFFGLLRQMKESNISILEHYKTRIQKLVLQLKRPETSSVKLEEDYILGNSDKKEEMKNNKIHSNRSNETKEHSEHSNGSNALFEISKKLTETHTKLEESCRKLQIKKSQCKELETLLQSTQIRFKLEEKEKLNLKKKSEQLEKDVEREMNERNEEKKRSALDSSNLFARNELLENENVRLRDKERILKNQNSYEIKMRQDLEKEFEKTKNGKEIIEEEGTQLKENCKKLYVSFEKLKQMAQSQLSEAGELYKTKVMELKTTKKKAKDLTESKEGIDLTLKSCQADLKTQRELKEKFQNRMKSLEEENSNLEKKNIETEETLRGLKQEMEKLRGEISSVTQIKERFMNQLLEKQDEIALLKESQINNQDSHEELTDLKKRLEQIVRENHELKSRLYDETEKNRQTTEENKELMIYLDKLLKEREK